MKYTRDGRPIRNLSAYQKRRKQELKLEVLESEAVIKSLEADEAVRKEERRMASNAFWRRQGAGDFIEDAYGNLENKRMES